MVGEEEGDKRGRRRGEVDDGGVEGGTGLECIPGGFEREEERVGVAKQE